MNCFVLVLFVVLPFLSCKDLNNGDIENLDKPEKAGYLKYEGIN
jgi:hypothetical protein